ncbi:MAG: hypothetical protein FD127_1295 [Acidimicrobiaceae bacterium]|jgi:hypothetical protein|nr:MAG: hypothetical protein FD127_1295 [Acidimicrobiaceae bacterium]
MRTTSPAASVTSPAASPAASLTSDRYLDDLAHLIARNGIGAFESDIARLVVRLRAAGIGGPCTDVLGDRHAAAVVRERAFGHLIGRVVRRSTCPVDVAA